jgi:hypothetical protein
MAAAYPHHGCLVDGQQVSQDVMSHSLRNSREEEGLKMDCSTWYENVDLMSAIFDA